MKSDNSKGNVLRGPMIEERKMVSFQRRQRLDSVRESGLRQTGKLIPNWKHNGTRPHHLGLAFSSANKNCIERTVKWKAVLLAGGEGGLWCRRQWGKVGSASGASSAPSKVKCRVTRQWKRACNPRAGQVTWPVTSLSARPHTHIHCLYSWQYSRISDLTAV